MGATNADKQEYRELLLKAGKGSKKRHQHQKWFSR